MAEDEQAKSGTVGTETPFWDSMGEEQPPFLNLDEETKKQGIYVKFLKDKPRKEATNNFDTSKTDCWFDVVYMGETFTWTISQQTLLYELKKHAPLGGKTLFIQLQQVSEEFKRQNPKFKGDKRYEVQEVTGEDAKKVEQPEEAAKDTQDNKQATEETVQ